MSAVTLIFPHQLLEQHPAMSMNRTVYLIEEFLFFNQYNFHKQKLVFHRAGMKAYQEYLERKGFAVIYVEAHERTADIRQLLPHLKKKGVSEIHFADVTDFLLGKRLITGTDRLKIKAISYDSPLFILTGEQVRDYFFNKKHFLQSDFYIRQRKAFKILVDDKLQPAGGQWSFDAENRLRYPKGKTPPPVFFPRVNHHQQEATKYIERYFPNNCGEISSEFIYPVTFFESRAWLKQFLLYRFTEFGAYEDALVKSEHILHHSLLTPMLNTGLLTPKEIIRETIVYARKHNIPINSSEGFIRQILGWREFIRGVYEAKGTQERTTNYWKFKRRLPSSYWDGTTGIPPVDITIKKVLATGYCHHIERLMVLGNFMLLCEFDPDDVYRWFMELFIDAYDWVMVPNVYGMSQFADGGLLATKPYISGSNYLMKMSDFDKGDWQATWDGLFWRFMHTHRNFFLSNPRLSMLVRTFDKMPKEKQQGHLRAANDFLNKLDRSSH
ncbi:MAG TPA: cryptochrome/photolyase family protein [Cyclobacteriaceae bacterium]|nr:cryptochrome/photolyase family protein [Cyclobacteriaceae bacterium]